MHAGAQEHEIAFHSQMCRNYLLSDTPSDMCSDVLSHSLADDSKADADRQGGHGC